eukprot:1151144-Rhodomonas_salina.1
MLNRCTAHWIPYSLAVPLIAYSTLSKYRSLDTMLYRSTAHPIPYPIAVQSTPYIVQHSLSQDRSPHTTPSRT